MEDLLPALRALPDRYQPIAYAHVNDAPEIADRSRAWGPFCERLVRAVLEFEGLHVSRPQPLYAVPGTRGRVVPDFLVGTRNYVEVTKWGDSNKLASILANGILVKTLMNGSRYFAVVASYGVPSSWTDDAVVDFYLGTAAPVVRGGALHRRPPRVPRARQARRVSPSAGMSVDPMAGGGPRPKSGDRGETVPTRQRHGRKPGRGASS